MFYYGFIGIIAVSAYIFIEASVTGEGFRFSEYTGRQYLIALASNMCDSFALFASTIAFQADASSFVGLFSYMAIVYSYFFD